MAAGRHGTEFEAWQAALSPTVLAAPSALLAALLCLFLEYAQLAMLANIILLSAQATD